MTHIFPFFLGGAGFIVLMLLPAMSRDSVSPVRRMFLNSPLPSYTIIWHNLFSTQLNIFLLIICFFTGCTRAGTTEGSGGCQFDQEQVKVHQ